MPAVHVSDLSKVYRVPVRESGLRASLGSLVHPSSRDVVAVAGISFDIEPGEVVGLPGPNDAGFTRLVWRTGLRYYSGASA